MNGHRLLRLLPFATMSLGSSKTAIVRYNTEGKQKKLFHMHWFMFFFFLSFFGYTNIMAIHETREMFLSVSFHSIWESSGFSISCLFLLTKRRTFGKFQGIEMVSNGHVGTTTISILVLVVSKHGTKGNDHAHNHAGHKLGGGRRGCWRTCCSSRGGSCQSRSQFGFPLSKKERAPPEVAALFSLCEAAMSQTAKSAAGTQA